MRCFVDDDVVLVVCVVHVDIVVTAVVVIVIVAVVVVVVVVKPSFLTHIITITQVTLGGNSLSRSLFISRYIPPQRHRCTLYLYVVYIEKVPSIN